jgi:hypothetical protein
MNSFGPREKLFFLSCSWDILQWKGHISEELLQQNGTQDTINQSIVFCIKIIYMTITEG